MPDIATLPFEAMKWDFPEESSAGHVTALHPYPARFIPAIPRQAVRALAPRKSVVLDPFAGAGTTLIEALKAGHTAVGIDVNHLAHLLQAVYTTPLTDAEWRSLIALAQTPVHDSELGDDELRSVRARIPRLDHWFSIGAIHAIGSFIRQVKSSVLSERAQRVALFALSRVVVRLSRQESDTQYRAVKPDITTKKAAHSVLSSLQECVSQLPNYHAQLAATDCQLRLGDARDSTTWAELPKVDLVVTSPPYPNAYEYWLYHKYRMFWLDVDPLWSRAREIGARPFYSGTGKLSADDFRQDMRAVLEHIDSRSSEDCRQLWVVGDGIVKGEIVPTGDIICAAAEELGWTPVQRQVRKLARRRSSFQGIGRMKEEEVILLGRA